jgi:hypothetical protein
MRPHRHGRIVDFWAAFSGALALLTFVLLFLFSAVLLVGGRLRRRRLRHGGAATRGRLTNYLLSVVIVLAVITTGILWAFWEVALILLLRGRGLWSATTCAAGTESRAGDLGNPGTPVALVYDWLIPAAPPSLLAHRRACSARARRSEVVR